MFIRAASLLMVAACLDQPSLAEVDQPLSGQCPIWQCGSNSPFIDNYGFHDANKYGAANDAGFRIVSFKKDPGLSYQLDVAGGRLIGRNAQGIGVLFGPQLVGSKILMVNNVTQRQFLVRINGVGSVDYWAMLPGGSHPPRETYLLEWVLTLDGVTPAPASRYQNVCKLAGQVNPDDLMGMNGYHTVLFEGERINAAAKTIDPRLDVDWFNIGCAGHALAKLELTGHTEVAHYAGFATTMDQRQTMLKMLVADYTGSGIPYTIAGMPLSWADDNGSMKHLPMITGIESRWTKYGADCLEEPRTKAHWSAAVAAAFPGTNGDVEAEMGTKRPPTCKDLDWTLFDGYHLVTANPP